MRAILLLVMFPLSVLAEHPEDLIGSWTGLVDDLGFGLDDTEMEQALEFQFKEDGVLIYIQRITLDDGTSEPVEISLEGTGTWSTEGEKIWLEVGDISFDEDTLVLAREFARGMARGVADILGISDEDYPAFEEEAVAEFMASFEQTGEGFAVEGTFALEDDVLTLNLAEYPVDLQRKQETAVRGISWGRLKESSR